ncbi:hypothetical protein FE257_013091 [Aspergillus nanangensis]|uniref:DUF3824 domain-containing protein n=1 Tax=Aspergillus nanangensis TaxID=2582783 RepID=A0AAD4CEZ6_ASPNN|nr:hypothetical protein FE257_013091 [Aspergillus nanangensis]
MSYIYRERERDRDWEEPRSPVTIKRYVVSEDDRDRDRDVLYRREDPLTGDRELVIRRSTDRDDSAMLSRYDREVDYDRRSERDYYEREYSEPGRPRRHHTAPIVIRENQPVIIQEARGPVYVNPRESDYEIVHRSEVDRDPAYYYHRRVTREYDDDRRLRREISPGDSVSQATRRREDQDYSSDDSMVYIRKETREYDDHPNHRRHLAEGALVGVGAAELLRSRRKKDGDEVSGGMGRVGRDVGAGALGAIAVNAASRAREYYRSKSRHRSHSFDDDRSSRSHHRHHHHSYSHSRRSRSRSHSHSRARTFAEIGLGAAAIAGAVALARNKSNGKSKNDRRSRSRHRRSMSTRSTRGADDEKRSESQRRKHMAGAGLAGAAVAGLVEKARSRSRSHRRKHSRSQSRLRKALPLVAAGLGTAAATGLYEKHKDKKDDEESRNRGRRRSRSRSRAGSDIYPDPSRDSAGLIEYGEHPVHGSIPAADYYGRPRSQQGYHSDASDLVARNAAGFNPRHRGRSHSRSVSRPGRHSSSPSGSDRSHRRHRKSKHRSKSRDLAEAALAASGVGYAAHKYSQHKDRKKAEKDAERRYDDRREPYEDSYSSEPYAPSPSVQPALDNQFYPNSNYFPPPPGSGPRPAPAYNPGDYPPPLGAVNPPQPYGYPSPPVPEPYAPRPRRADENVSVSWNSSRATAHYSTHDGLESSSVRNPRKRVQRPQSQPAQPKSVAFNISRPTNSGYETDDSDSTVQSVHTARPQRHDNSRRRNSSSAPDYRSRSRHDYGDDYEYDPSYNSRQKYTQDIPTSNAHRRENAKKTEPESDSDATIELPDRFDSKGRLLPQQRREDPLADRFEDLLRGVGRVFA